MAGSPSDRVLRQVHRLFNFGAVGTMSDAQLLDRFVSRRDEAAEAAFEELVIRHGPMVLRVCRSVLHDAHDAEDAFQAVFLVLANRAGSIRRSGSVASWLFGVAQRVATRGKRSAARRQHARPARRGADLRKLSPAGERSRLGDPPRGDRRLARAASRTRRALLPARADLRRGGASARALGGGDPGPAGPGARAAAPAADPARRDGPGRSPCRRCGRSGPGGHPVTLIHSTIRIALGFMAGNTAAVLAQGVLNSMLLNQVKVATTLLALVSGVAIGPGTPSPGRPMRKAEANPGRASARHGIGVWSSADEAAPPQLRSPCSRLP